MTTPRIEERRGRKIGEDKYTEHWSLDGHTYIQVPKWVITQAHQAGIDEAVEKILEVTTWYQRNVAVDEIEDGVSYIKVDDIKELQDNK